MAEIGSCILKAEASDAILLMFASRCPGLQTQGRESIAAKLVANLITEAGAHRVLICDLHSGQSMGYFDIPVDHVYGQVCGKPLAQLSTLFGVSCIMSTWMLYSKRCSIAICSNNTVISI